MLIVAVENSCTLCRFLTQILKCISCSNNIFVSQWPKVCSNAFTFCYGKSLATICSSKHIAETKSNIFIWGETHHQTIFTNPFYLCQDIIFQLALR